MLNVDLKDISLKDPKVKLALCTLGIVFITFYIGNKLIIKPYNAKKAELKATLENINLQDSVAKLSNEVYLLENRLPPQKDPAWLLTQLTRLSRESDLYIQSIEPQTHKQMDPYKYPSFKIKTECTFNTLLNFLKNVESAKQKLHIESLSLNSSEKGTRRQKEEEASNDLEASVEIVIGTIY